MKKVLLMASLLLSTLTFARQAWINDSSTWVDKASDDLTVEKITITAAPTKVSVGYYANVSVLVRKEVLANSNNQILLFIGNNKNESLTEMFYTGHSNNVVARTDKSGEWVRVGITNAFVGAIFNPNQVLHVELKPALIVQDWNICKTFKLWDDAVAANKNYAFTLTYPQASSQVTVLERQIVAE